MPIASTGLVLQDSHIAWISKWLERVAAPDDLERTYSLAHSLNAARDRGSIRAMEEPEAKFLWALMFRDASNDPVLELPLSRSIFPEWPLANADGLGAVVYNNAFYLREENRGRGFASALYPAEMELYIGWGIREIRLSAAADGTSVWMKHFGFRPVEPELLALDFARWQRRKGREPIELEPAELPLPFLRELGSIELYKECA